MTNYVKSTSFSSKDTLAIGNPLKIVRGTEIDAEFNNIAISSATKADLLNPVFTGAPTAPTPALGTSNTQLATTAFVQATTSAGVVPSGSVMLFVQTTAPTGWTKSTTHNNKALRVVSGAVGSGGSVGFTTAFGTLTVTGSVGVDGTVGNTTLTVDQIPSHTHPLNREAVSATNVNGSSIKNTDLYTILNAETTSATGGGGSHTHSFSGTGAFSGGSAVVDVQYVDVIIAVKN